MTVMNETMIADSARGARHMLQAVNFHGVQLREGRLLSQLEEVCRTSLQVSDDALLWPFRVRKGHPSPGTPLRGWYGEGLFNNFGQFLTLYARLFAATRDRAFADKAMALMEGWATTIDEDGFFLNSMSAAATEYSYDKMVCGLLDVHEYVGSRDALRHLRRISVWMQRHGTTARPFAWSGLGPLEWYTLPEYLWRAHTVTQDPLYAELAESYTYDEFYDALRDDDHQGLMDRADQVHNFYQAHSHLNTLNSALARFESTGEEKYLDAALSGHKLMLDTQVFATGMLGPLEALMKPGQRAEVLHSEVAHAEVSCPSWALMRLVRHLIEITGEAQFGDWMELNIYNGVGAAATTSPEGRATQYFADYGFSGAQKTRGLEWTCCSATNGINVAEYVNQIYYLGENAVHVCLYVPSVVTLEVSGAVLRLEQSGTLPLDERVVFDIGLDRAIKARLGFRVPAWARRQPQFTLNGDPVVPVVEAGWAMLDRLWRSGDQVVMTLELAAEIVQVEPQDVSSPVAVRWGPVVLVSPQDDSRRVLSRDDIESVVRTLRRASDSELRFVGEAAGGGGVELIPYFAVLADEEYAMHFADDARRLSYTDLAYFPEEAWEQADVEQYLVTKRRTYRVSEAAGAAFEVEFHGTGVVWCGYRTPHGGYADVFLDGLLVERVSQLGRSDLQPSLWSMVGLEPGPHVLRVVVSQERPDGSRGSEVNVKHVRIVD